MSSLWQSLELFLCFIFSVTISGDSVYYFLEMIMLISLKGTLNQTRMGVGRVTLPSKGPVRGHFVFLVAKSQIVVGFVINY